MTGECHISSLVVHSRPDRVPFIVECIGAIAGSRSPWRRGYRQTDRHPRNGNGKPSRRADQRASSSSTACSPPPSSSTISSLSKSGSRAMDLTRRTILKAQAAAAAAAAAGISLPADAQNILTGEDLQLQWSKAPCRFCGTGCGVMVGVKDGQGRRHPRRHAGGGQSRPQLREGLLPLQDHVRQRPAHPAAPAHEERPVRQGRRVPARLLGPGLRRDGAAVEAGAARRRDPRRSACSARASGRSGRAMPPPS